jgi:nitric oxide reductase subunit B
MDVMTWINKQKNWWKTFAVIFFVSVLVVGYIGAKTYEFAPPRADYVDQNGDVVFSSDDIIEGQQVFFRYGLMDYGSFLGDGAMRGPDFTGEALHLTAVYMNEYYDREWQGRFPDEEERDIIVQSLVQKELKENTHDEAANTVTLTAAGAHAARQVEEFYSQKFGSGGDLAGIEVFKPTNYITDPVQIHQLSAFFYWGGWLSGVERPGYEYSYTHNWPYDPLAGNLPHGGLVFWSVLGVLVVILTIGFLFYYYGKTEMEKVLDAEEAKAPPLATTDFVDGDKPMPTQRAMYKFFAVAAVLFLIQITAGLLVISDFLTIFTRIGIPIDEWLPITITRAWHTQISVLWIAVCWFAATIWILPLICRPEPKGQLQLINILFGMLLFVGVGGAIGIPLGIQGFFGEDESWRWFGHQGWEFLQIGRIYQVVLYASFLLWFTILARGVWPVLRQKKSWSLPNWMVYMAAGIIFMFTSSFVATPETNFVIADFWRWVTVHMWVEAFFELFTTVIAAYFFYLMGFVTHAVAARVVFLGAVLFLGSGLIGISHNFYWNAKSIETIALGGVFSSLQIAPLVLLTVEAWRLRKLPDSTLSRLKAQGGKGATFGLTEAFMFIIAVNFWNFLGAGVLGFMINLPIVNYYQHGTYLTVNHGHMALMGVYGNLAIAAMLFCGRWLIRPDRWNASLIRTSFWSLNIGLMLMGVMDLFPVGLHQLNAVFDGGYAFARSEAYLQGAVFMNLTMLRGVGVLIFVAGGVLPLVWFMVTRWGSLKPVQTIEESYVVPTSVLALAPGYRPREAAAAYVGGAGK